VGLSIAKQAAAGLVAATNGSRPPGRRPHNIMLTPQSDVKIMDFGSCARRNRRDRG
jgi:serine/threonine protein kinase